MSADGPGDWPRDSEGYPHRQAARVVLCDARGRLLLAIGHDADDPARQWWFTIGGGIEEGEDPAAGAVREVREETGIRLRVEDLVGPVLYRTAEFDFAAVTARQDEWFFVARTECAEVSREGWTDLEKEVLDGLKWWDLDELEALDGAAEVYPRQLVGLAREWRDGWDGRLVSLTGAREP